VAARRAAIPPFARRLLRWFDMARRDLPWRRTRDPWAIWVSEVMLQQTRVEAVRAPFERFLQRFPTPGAFASVGDDELLVAWRGLGYYRRARLLREGARVVVREHDGVVPTSLERLAELPGIGDYTCGAVARVVARHRGIEADIATASARRAVRTSAARWLDPERAGDFNQALMELGAIVCTPTSPRCEACPVAADCVARRTGRAGELPRKRPPRAPIVVSARVALVTRGGSVLGHRLPPGEPNAGQVELPGAGVLASTDAADLATAIAARFGARVQVGEAIAVVRHAITHHRIMLTAHAATMRQRGRLAWFPLGGDTPWTTPARKVFRAAIGGVDARRA
jgi:A/G-specific adenine glycosylase